MQHTALILIDIQNDYFAGGALTLTDVEPAADNAYVLLDLFRSKQLPIIHIQHESLMPEPAIMLPGTQGQLIHPRLTPKEGEVSLCKHYPNAFWETSLESILKAQGITNVIIAGMMTHMCVSTTVRAAMERGFNVTTIQDACATSSLTLDDNVIPADVVQQTSLAELTFISKVCSLNQFMQDL